MCAEDGEILFSVHQDLALILLCKPRTPVRELLHIWPPLPIIITGFKHHPTSGLDNVVAALEQNDRVCEITLHDLSFLQLEEVAATMLQPFHALEYLDLRTYEDVVPTFPIRS